QEVLHAGRAGNEQRMAVQHGPCGCSGGARGSKRAQRREVLPWILLPPRSCVKATMTRVPMTSSIAVQQQLQQQRAFTGGCAVPLTLCASWRGYTAFRCQ